MAQRYCFLLRVRPDRMDEYRRRRQAVWPEMLEALWDTGWRKYSPFLHDDELLVGYVEVDDLQAPLAAMAGTRVNARWQAEMAPSSSAWRGPGPTRASSCWTSATTSSARSPARSARS